MLVKVYGVEAVSKKCVFEWFKRFRVRKEDVKDEPRSGRPPTSTTPDNIERVRRMLADDRRMLADDRRMLADDRRLSLRMIAEELKISLDSVSNIIHEHLQKHSGGTVVEDIDETTRKESCLSKETAERLGELSIEIEKFYRSSRDIEWGVLKDKIYILQGGHFTYQDKQHLHGRKRKELPLHSAHYLEVLPGATSPLAIELVSKFYAVIMKRAVAEKGFIDNSDLQYYPPGSQAFCNHMTMAIAEIIASYGADTPMAKGLMISMFGRILDDPEFLQCVKGKVKDGKKPSLKQQLKSYWDLFMYDLGLQNMKNKTENYHFNFLKAKTAKETFRRILNSCSDFDKELAIQIEKDTDCKEFRAMSVEKAEEWLQTTKKLSGLKFREFLKRHGHRCLKEFDVHSITWGMDSKPLVKLLQNLVGAKRMEKKKEDDIDKTISTLHTPLNSWAKFRLKYVVLPNCRKGVGGREAGKSLMIKCIDHWRKGFRHLAKLMVSEGRLPDEELLFFLTFDEIDDLLNTRSPSIISRANQRRRIHPILDSYKFPELMRGLPKPINDEEESAKTYQSVADLTMKGVPVSQGVAKGYARVAISLVEASYLKPGEILITHSTDIGWSPYFPIVSGVVTEIGGLISHGAVVSREYGLPCVVGLTAATKMFRTGDYVLLDGKKGIIQRLPPPK
ncbi:Putative phosphoenolpyruvate synthase [Araneus ventricosus]|uniref:Phosphoenolpyruvate synthase n=1 Tax=Araneus ventricosus TaxID=182803 RepID=A0A4Y2FXT9_ARAVE|nr:Putative phosphoenolpyruvate synthase [Araneus ventricosus]